MNTSKQISSNKSVKIYDDYADIPVVPNWENIVERGRIEFLIANEKKRRHKVPPRKLLRAYDKISDQYFQAMDIDLINEELFVLIQKRIEARDKFINGDKSQMNFIKMYSRTIDEIKKNEVKASFSKNRLGVEKWFGQPLKGKTLKEFTVLVKMIQEESELVKRKNHESSSEE